MHFPPPRAQGLYDPRSERDACGVGVVVDIPGRKSHEVVLQGLEVLERMAHRGACGCEENTGDGAGILLQVPHDFCVLECRQLDIPLPDPGAYATGLVFLPLEVAQRNACQEIVERVVRRFGQELLGWRDVPIDRSGLGPGALASLPVIRQVFVGRSGDLPAGDPMAFERRLYVIRRKAEKAVEKAGLRGMRQSALFHITSLSARTMVYKGMLTPGQLRGFFPDLLDPAVRTALCLVHSRFSTNTFPSWDLAQPFRMICHNGEINTLRGNINWMRAREGLLDTRAFGVRIRELLPVLREAGSDSSVFDQMLELLVLGGRSLPHAMMMLVPEAYAGHATVEGAGPGDPARKAFYAYHACLMEPWDGPALIAFSDGRLVGAVLDRNGLRPARWLITRGGRCVMASETGVLDIPPEDVLHKGRLQPGRMFLIDTGEGRLVPDEEIKAQVAGERPYAEWLREHLVPIEDLPEPPGPGPAPTAAAGAPDLRQLQLAFGYTVEERDLLIRPAATDATEPIGSMGNDAPLAVLSRRPRLLFDYFKQGFAQVTNPPLDAIREELVTSAEITLGPEGNLFDLEPSGWRQIQVPNPVLSETDLARLRDLPDDTGLRSVVLPMHFLRGSREQGLWAALRELCIRAELAIREGAKILILSDRDLSEERVPIPSLLATAALHHSMVEARLRTQVSLVVDSGEPREPHHFCLLIGFGAAAVTPYLAYRVIAEMAARGDLPSGLEPSTAIERYRLAQRKAIVKVMSKMGISTIQSYCGAQIFEAVGLSEELIERWFPHTPSRIDGVGLDTLAREAQLRHDQAFPPRGRRSAPIELGGAYRWRRHGEQHVNSPEAIALLQQAVRSGSYEVYRAYTRAVDGPRAEPRTLRDLFDLRPAGSPVPLDEVEPVEAILRRFKTGAMSYGSISREAHEAIAIAMNRLGGKSNTGEGGEDPERFSPDANGVSRNSAIKQVASGRFGVTSAYLVNAEEIQIKMAQGAKPGEGGQLPGHKVDAIIAKIRHATPGVGLISPPPHHDIYSIEDLAQLIYDLKNVNPRARIGVKLVAASGVGTVAAGVAKAKADVILISGHDGGTGAAPLTSLKHAGLPWELGLAEAHQVLVMNDLRSRVTLETDGQLKTGRDVVLATLLGAEEFGFATAPLIALGCVMMRVCHLNTCPVGIATQDVRLRERFAGEPEHVERFFRFVAQDVRERLAALGARKLTDLVGRTQRIGVSRARHHWKARHLDLSPILHRPDPGRKVGLVCGQAQDHGLDRALDHELIARSEPALDRAEPVRFTVRVGNVDRAVGTMLGGELSRRYGDGGLPDDTIQIQLFGSAGQSLGAFLPRGITLMLEGDANDYLGKGLSGGKIALRPPRRSGFPASKNIIAGNVCFYGATRGEAYVRGMVGERFCVRNSGLSAVVEGVGDHGCEYMTGGRVVVLGATGRNFAAGMSGGVAWVRDVAGDFETRCNSEMVDLEALDARDDEVQLRALIERHVLHTGSRLAREILDDWSRSRDLFVRVMPKEYARALARQRPGRAAAGG